MCIRIGKADVCCATLRELMLDVNVNSSVAHARLVDSFILRMNMQMGFIQSFSIITFALSSAPCTDFSSARVDMPIYNEV